MTISFYGEMFDYYFCQFVPIRHLMLQFLILYNIVHFVTVAYRALVQDYFCPFQNPFTLHLYTWPTAQ